MKTELLIELYDIHSEKFLKEIDISHYDIKTINEICPPEDSLDLEYCDGYFVEEKDLKKLKKYIIELKDYKYDDYIYNIITRQG